MTLIIANKDGLYADRRGVNYHGTTFTKVNKIFLPKLDRNYTKPSAVCGVSGSLEQCGGALSLFSNLCAAASRLLYCAERYNAGRFLDYRDALADGLAYHFAGHNDMFQNSLLLVATRHHNFVFDSQDRYIPLTSRDADYIINQPETFLAVGSGASQSYFFNSVGVEPLEIYKKAAIIDSHVSRDVDFYPRSKLGMGVATAGMTWMLKELYAAIKESEKRPAKDVVMNNNKRKNSMVLITMALAHHCILVDLATKNHVTAKGQRAQPTPAHLRKATAVALKALKSHEPDTFEENVEHLKKIVNIADK